jgi:Holliday junction resolvase
MRSRGSSLEKEIVERLKRRLQSQCPSAKWIKLHGGVYQEVGLPDLMGTVHGRTVCIEVKTAVAYNKPSHHLSVNQIARLTEYARAGAHVYVTDGDRWDDLTASLLDGGHPDAH